MIEAQVEKAQGLLKVRYSGRVGAEETGRGVVDLERLLEELERGFRLLADLSDLEAMDLACEPDLKRMMDLCNAKGVKLIVRIIPDPSKDIGLNIMSLFHYRHRVRIVTCQTLAEGLRILAEP